MALKAIFENEADIPAELKDHYTARDGKWFLTLDSGEAVAGDQLKRALDTERKQREAATKQLDQLKAQLAELEKSKQEAGAAAAQAGNQGTPAGDEIQRQLLAQKKAFDDQLKQLRETIEAEKGARQKAEEGLWQNKLEEGLTRAAMPLVVEGGIDDVLNRSRQFWKRDEAGNPVPMDGDSVIYGIKDPTKPMPFDEFIQERVLKSAKHLLKPSNGAGAQGGGGNSGSVIRITREQAKDSSAYQAAKQQSEKTGRPLEIVRSA